ncbi:MULTISPECIES: 16S rRNA (cytosine(967)-C(5))-methyltransferase [Pseudanabaena]|uniref:16S rRNA (cytosine(967)-C(5))-methyltransferase n=2 Tax=Pseudanabaena TaxID=1152 RepID=L8MYE7_9CYAN|nr:MULTISPECIES: 16S rRNA (cytosine(967)-C(5))-methyltransferase [Pseudanabaena]ELS31003.1 sun protein [Pseudanabaena biceps PCC 7429]MDG3496736.1 16S rRNA (cytosine(967)-C(5))-methyltransferase [Pseudanabaena catenata USMAC16]
MTSKNSRQIALEALRLIQRRNAYADVALDCTLSKARQANITLLESDRRLITELVYGCTRRQKTLQAVLQNFSQKPIAKLPPDLLIILQIGVYQLCFLDRIKASAIVHTTVELVKENKLAGLSGFANGVMRSILRAKEKGDILADISDPASFYSYPEWLIDLWQKEFGQESIANICNWFNQTPHLDLRVNLLHAKRDQVLAAFAEAGIVAEPIPHLPDGIRVGQGAGEVSQLPKFKEGWWSVQDASAQLVTYLLDPQPHEIVVDACAAPGGKTTHISDRLKNTGKVYALDRLASRLKKVEQNAARLGITNVQTIELDAREFAGIPEGKCDRVLLDVPCSGLGTLHRHADARWRQTPDEPYKLAKTQSEILAQAMQWVKPEGVIVYSTCTIHPAENEEVIEQFLTHHPDWQIVPPSAENPAAHFASDRGWVKVLPHEHNMDGFFMVKLQKRA